jgi:subtilisin family serine protease
MVDRFGKGEIGIMNHGTAALGIIGAKGDLGFGMAGINWNISMMLLKEESAQGTGSTRLNKKMPINIARSIHYAVDNGAKIINWSGFLEDPSKKDKKVIEEAFQYAEKHGVLIVMAAGNARVDIDDPKSKMAFPTNKDFANVIYVANVDPCGNLVDFSNEEKSKSPNHHVGGSNWGYKRVLIAAPGERGLTTTTTSNGQESYFLGGGTSDAAPMVTGVAALVLSVNPKLKYPGLIEILCASTKKLDSLKNKVRCGGIPDAEKALQLAKDQK